MTEKLVYGKVSSKTAMELEEQYGAHNYHPLPIVIAKGEGPFVWDPEGKRYYDFLSAYSAVNQGHCHPKIVNAMIEQAKTITLTSRAFFNNKLGEFEKFITEFFDFEMVLAMNSGAEAVETAMKLARRWGYVKKGIPENEAVLVFCDGNFHGRTITIISVSTDPDCRTNFGPYTPGFATVPYNDVNALEEYLEKNGKKVAAFFVEPIQGEAGVYVPDDGYLKKCFDICKKHNVLFVADEIQSGIARTGKLLACDWDNVKPDILILGKALSGGAMPVSAVLSSKDIMLTIKPGEHGSTYGGNPLACAVATAAMEVVRDEKLAERSQELGVYFREELNKIKHPMLTKIRGKGLLNAIIIEPKNGKEAWDVCVMLKDKGLICKPTHRHIIRLAPPLVISKEQLDECVQIIKSVFDQL
ncbi:MAG TPA: ornithine--oxo-acid transaminase [Candidatus Cloacimonadota bacterium]|jgi:ornithine--oxo-acid transaminase|nr:ornithine--oxo-acid transaminase [Candidatus Cloacimonadales bacterium]HPY95794.1 ornithine--oxo-acid transaminase [Candidatus Cloacimonadota bacterium]HQB40497.1 ornithine--oxo-acid transaminase [Candidatus Cloacimonadota bacterium]